MTKSSKQSESKLKRAKGVPWAVLLQVGQVGLVFGRRWRSLSAKDRARLTRLTRESKGRLGNLSKRERKELRKLVGKLDYKRAGRELVLLNRAARRRRKRKRS